MSNKVIDNKKKTRHRQFCAICCATYSMRRKECSCGNRLSETTAPAALECDHCGDEAIESASGLFLDGDGGKCAACGFPGWVSVDEDTAYWRTEDVDPKARCARVGCDECPAQEDTHVVA